MDKYSSSKIEKAKFWNQSTSKVYKISDHEPALTYQKGIIRKEGYAT